MAIAAALSQWVSNGQRLRAQELSSLVTNSAAEATVSACVLRHHLDAPAAGVDYLETAVVDVTESSSQVAFAASVDRTLDRTEAGNKSLTRETQCPSIEGLARPRRVSHSRPI